MLNPVVLSIAPYICSRGEFGASQETKLLGLRNALSQCHAGSQTQLSLHWCTEEAHISLGLRPPSLPARQSPATLLVAVVSARRQLRHLISHLRQQGTPRSSRCDDEDSFRPDRPLRLILICLCYCARAARMTPLMHSIMHAMNLHFGLCKTFAREAMQHFVYTLRLGLTSTADSNHWSCIRIPILGWIALSVLIYCAEITKSALP